MGEFPLDTVLAVVGIAVPVAAFVWEFVVAGRRRIGYRVQMDTPVTGEVESVFPGVLGRLRPVQPTTASALRDLSVVLVRIENSGTTTIERGDYLAPGENVGLHLRFPNRRVVGMAVTELSDQALRDCLDEHSGIAVREENGGRVGVIDLPKVPLNRGEHYKILAILDRAARAPEHEQPVLEGNLRGGRIAETRSRTGVPRAMVVLTGFLVAVIVGQFAVAMVEEPPMPLDCAAGAVNLTGSSAFEPVIREAAGQYEKRCRGVRFTYDFDGTERGLDRLSEVGPDGAVVAFGDGPKGPGYTAFRARAVALAVYGVFVHAEVAVDDLTVAQVRDIYQGRVTNWRELGGPDLPVVVVDRVPGSGSRAIFADALLDGTQQLREHRSCRSLENTEGTYCVASVTRDMHDAVRDIPGAIGYSELAEARRAGMRVIALGGVAPDRQAAVDGDYPFWGVEYVYTHGDPPVGSAIASFLHYITVGPGTEVLRALGNEPCSGGAVDPGTCAPRS